MRSWINRFTKALIILTVIYYASASMEETSDNMIVSNNPYRHPMDIDLLSRLLLIPQQPCHSKRNSELINSLLSLPKNINSAGK